MKRKILRIGITIIAIAVCFLLQVNIARWVPFFSVVPNLLLIFTFSVGFLRGKMSGLLTGLACGLLMDAFSGDILGYYTLIFIYIGYFNGFLTRILVHDMLIMPVILCAVNELIYSLYIYVFSYLLFGHVNLGDFVFSIALPELLLTAVFSIILYGIIMAIDRWLTESEKKGENSLV